MLYLKTISTKSSPLARSVTAVPWGGNLENKKSRLWNILKILKRVISFDSGSGGLYLLKVSQLISLEIKLALNAKYLMEDSWCDPGNPFILGIKSHTFPSGIVSTSWGKNGAKFLAAKTLMGSFGVFQFFKKSKLSVSELYAIIILQ